MLRSDAYRVLGLPETASKEEVKVVYRRLAKRHHPDLNPSDKGASERFARISIAAQVILKDKDSGSRPAGQSGDYAESSRKHRDTFWPKRGDNIYVTIEISLERAFAGGTQSLGTEVAGDCLSCRGTGKVRSSGSRECDLCNGHGVITKQNGWIRVRVPCTRCNGVGLIPDNECKSCHGTGKSQSGEPMVIHVPAGIIDGESLHFPRKGQSGVNGGEPGDLEVTVRVKRHPRFRREGIDLRSSISLLFTDLCLGKRAHFINLDGEKLAVLVQPGTQASTELVLREKGMPGRDGKRGDLKLNISVEIPRNITPDLSHLLQDCRAHGL